MRGRESVGSEGDMPLHTMSHRSDSIPPSPSLMSLVDSALFVSDAMCAARSLLLRAKRSDQPVVRSVRIESNRMDSTRHRSIDAVAPRSSPSHQQHCPRACSTWPRLLPRQLLAAALCLSVSILFFFSLFLFLFFDFLPKCSIVI